MVWQVISFAMKKSYRLEIPLYFETVAGLAGRPSLTDIAVLLWLIRGPGAYSEMPKAQAIPVSADAPPEWKAFLSKPVKATRPAFYRATRKLINEGLIRAQPGFPTSWRIENEGRAKAYIVQRLCQVLPQPQRQVGRPRTRQKRKQLSKAFSVLRKPGRLQDLPEIKVRTDRGWKYVTGFIGTREAEAIARAKRIDDGLEEELRKMRILRRMAHRPRGDRPEV